MSLQLKNTTTLLFYDVVATLSTSKSVATSNYFFSSCNHTINDSVATLSFFDSVTTFSMLLKK